MLPNSVTRPPLKSASEPSPVEDGHSAVIHPPVKTVFEPSPVEDELSIIAADRDRGCWWLRSRSGLEQISTAEFLKPGRFEDYDLLVVEAAHLNPRTNPPKSKAQIYTSAQLAAWTPGCPVRTVKELHAAKRRALFDIDGKKDGADAEAVYRYIMSVEDITSSTRKFPFEPVPDWLMEIIEDMNQRQNTSRIEDYLDPESQRVLPLFQKIADPTLDPFRFGATAMRSRIEKPSKRPSVARLGPAYVMAVWTALYEKDGTPRRDRQGRTISTRTVRRLLGMSHDAPRSVARGKIQHDLYGSGLGTRKGHERAEYAKSPEYREHRQRCEGALLRLIELARQSQPPPKSASEPSPVDVGQSEPLFKSASEPSPEEVHQGKKILEGAV